MCVILITKFSCGCAPPTGTLNCGLFYRSLPCTISHSKHSHPGLCPDHRPTLGDTPPSPRTKRRTLRQAATKRAARVRLEKEQRAKGLHRVPADPSAAQGLVAETGKAKATEKDSEKRFIGSDWIGDGRAAGNAQIARINRAVDERLNLHLLKKVMGGAGVGRANGSANGNGNGNGKKRAGTGSGTGTGPGTGTGTAIGTGAGAGTGRGTESSSEKMGASRQEPICID